jgi:hypothetical protein
MKLLNLLTQYFIDTGICDPELLESFAEDMTLAYIGKEDENGLRICDVKYTAQFYIERYNQHPGLLMAAVVVWLRDNDPYRADENLGDPSAVMDLVDDGTAEVNFTIEFCEPVYLIEDADVGVISFNGRLWAFGDFAPDVAETAIVSR